MRDFVYSSPLMGFPETIAPQWRRVSPRLSQAVCGSVCGLSYAGLTVYTSNLKKLSCNSDTLKSNVSLTLTVKYHYVIHIKLY